MRGVAQVQPITAVAMLVAGCAPGRLTPFPFVSELLVVSAVAAQDFASDTMEVGRFDHDDLRRDAKPRHRGLAVVLCRRVVRWVHVSYRDHGLGPRLTGSRGERGWTVGHVPLMIMIVALLGFGFVPSRADSHIAHQGGQRDCGEVIG